MTRSAPAAKPFTPAFELVARRVGDAEADSGRECAHHGDHDPHPQDRAPVATAGAHRARGADGFREVRHEDGREQAHAHPAARRQAESQHELLGYPVQEGAERQRGAGSGPLGAALDHTVENVERERSEGHADRHRARAADLHAVLRELEAHGAHESARAEREHQSHQALGPGARQADQGPEHQRRSRQRAPAESLSRHGAASG